MKDKLEKNGHKKNYYKFKKTLTGLCISLTALGCAVIPVGISFKMNIASVGKNNTNQVSLVESKKNNSEINRLSDDNKANEVVEEDETNLGVKDEKSTK